MSPHFRTLLLAVGAISLSFSFFGCGDEGGGASTIAYTSSGDPLVLLADEGALPADWQPNIVRREAVTIDETDFQLSVGPFYEFPDADFAGEVQLVLPAPNLTGDEEFAFVLYEPAIDDWIFVPHEIDTAAGVVRVTPPHFSTLAPVNAQITNSVTQASVPILGNPQALATGSLYQAVSQAVSNAAQSAAVAQQASNAITNAAVAQSTALIFGIDPGPSMTPLSTPAALSTQAGASVLASALPNPASPCDGDPCSPGTCAPSGAAAVCTCTPPLVAVGQSCGTPVFDPVEELCDAGATRACPGFDMVMCRAEITAARTQNQSCTDEFDASRFVSLRIRSSS